MKDKTMLINILAGIGAFFTLSSAWVIGVLIVSYRRHKRKQKAALQPRTTLTASTGMISLHPNCKTTWTWDKANSRIEGTEGEIAGPEYGELTLTGSERRIMTKAEEEAENIIRKLL